MVSGRPSVHAQRRRRACAVGLVLLLGAACHRAPRAQRHPEAAWDRVAFALQLVRQEYPELVEAGDFARAPALVRVLDGASAALRGIATDRGRTVAPQLADVRADVLRHAPPRVVAQKCRRTVAALVASGDVAPRPPRAPDLRRGEAAYQTGCAPCHGPPRGPPPATVASMVPQPPSATLGVPTPYELFNRITFGGAETPMPAFGDNLPADVRWDIAFWLFAARWPPCEGQYPALRSAELALLTDRDLWERAGWGAAACQRRSFRP
ncbi:MAG TPA: cytochrome c [Polyangia bacterium]|nr:cytochrome c [Polyangia bacterium]